MRRRNAPTNRPPIEPPITIARLSLDFAAISYAPHSTPQAAQRMDFMRQSNGPCSAPKPEVECPLWVKSGHRSASSRCLLCPQKRTLDQAGYLSLFQVIAEEIEGQSERAIRLGFT